MKSNLLKSLLAFFMLFAITTSYGQETKKNQKAVIKTSIVCDHCKECETCGAKFQSNMLKIKGVRMYELNDKEKTITVYYNTTKTDLQTIRTAISKLGYDADDVKADVAAYEKLDNCCKKA